MLGRFGSGKSFCRAAISAESVRSDYDMVWLNYWSPKGAELDAARSFARSHGLGEVIMVKVLPRRLAREDPCGEPAEYGGEY